ncbi:trypsin-like serine peptidase [Rhodovulum sulfidophilum]|uniref:Serine protease n=1 Tax=Rhodovulum sulfidophilum TaxID=35806 RepID=A0ABS1RZ05_RHOSU|nr:serine protease [Rhodovulum sulfidophilum]MBL3611311.1 trypsin-like peptidase domain-containing protein [Rhodovulum sulfidophilum]MCE8458384.1 serine protease [Rhodovulum sulfidophilum]
MTSEDEPSDDQEAHDAALAEVEARRQALNRHAEDEYGGMVSRIAAETVSAKVRGALPADPDHRRAKRVARDETVTMRDLWELAQSGIMPPLEREATVGRSDFLRVDTFVKGLVAARSIGRLDALGGSYFGTGFICAPGMIMTNNHVLPSETVASLTEIGFETYDGRTVFPACGLAPDQFWWTDEGLDVSIVALDPEKGEDISRRLGWHPMIPDQGKIALGDPTGVVQYPKGMRKSVVLHDSTVVFLQDHRESEFDQALWYTSDTERGASGSPVFNRHWEVVAVHHATVAARDTEGRRIDELGNPVSDEDYDRNPSLAVHVANKGIRTSRIVKGLTDAKFPERPKHAVIRDRILADWQMGTGQVGVRRAMRAVIARQWDETTGAADAPPNVVPAVDHDLEAARGAPDRTRGDLLDQLLDRVAPNGSLSITLNWHCD